MAEAHKLVEIVAHAGQVAGYGHLCFSEPWNNPRIEGHLPDIFAYGLEAASFHIGFQNVAFLRCVPCMSYNRLTLVLRHFRATVTGAALKIGFALGLGIHRL